jgi:tetratricopeptide (TPR) repeat protein
VITLFGIEGCVNFPEKRLNKDFFIDSEISMNAEHGTGVSEKSIQEAELQNMFPQFAKKWKGRQELAKARILMLNGYHNSSLKRNKEVLKLFPRILGDQALFQMGLNYAHPGNPNHNYTKSKKCFKRVLKEYPESDIRDKAGIWVLFLQEMMEKDRKINDLQNKIEGLQYRKKGLQYQIEKLKEVDIGIEEKKRELLLK